MIIQALAEHYNLLTNVENSPIAPMYFSKVGAVYEVVINTGGDLVDVIPLSNDKQLKFIVPAQNGRTAPGYPYFLCDNSQYLFGCTRKKSKNTKSGYEFIIESNEEKSFLSAKNHHQELLKDMECTEAEAVCRFFDKWDIYDAPNHPVLKRFETEKKSVLDKVNLVMRLEGSGRYIHMNEAFKEQWISYCEENKGNEEKGLCSISGKRSIIAQIHPSIKGMTAVGGKSQVAMVTFNHDAFESYNKKKGDNAPVSEKVASQYTSMLNELISDDNSHIRMGDDTLLLFWAGSAEPKYTSLIKFAMNGSQKEDIEAKGNILEMLKKVKDGVNTEYQSKTPFYLLAVSPNSSRIAIRYFYQSTFGDICKNVARHYEDIELIKGTFDQFDSIPLWRLLESTKRDRVPGGDSKEKLNPLLSGTMLKSVIEGNPYPALIFNLVMGRIKAGNKINRERVSIIKGYINRIRKTNHKEELTVSCNEKDQSTAYVLGRLFSTLEYIQKKSIGFKKDAKTIKDSYFTSACSTPASVFPRLFKLSQHHMAVLESGSDFLDCIIGQLLAKLDITTFPKQLSLEQQGVFILGYYHENQSRFFECKEYNEVKAKEDKENDNTDELSQ